MGSMKFDKTSLKKSMLLYAVTDRTWLGQSLLAEQVKLAILGGVTCVQLREKNLSDDEFLSEAIKIRELCNAAKIPFIINDRVDIAVKSGADGVHVGQSDMNAQDVRSIIGEDMILGVSAQTLEQALLAERSGADYLGVGAVFSTSTKLDANSVSHSVLKEICKTVNIPVVAIGGISKQNISQLKDTDIDGVAVVSAIFASEDIENACNELVKLTESVVNG